jgi:PAS domain S-box-containing protein
VADETPGGNREARGAGDPTAEERYRALFDHSRDAIYLHDFQGRFIDANVSALDLLGFSRDDIRTLTFADLVTNTEDLTRAFTSIRELFAADVRQPVAEYLLRRKDGQHVWVELVGSLVRRNGEPWAVQGVARDVTERKRADAELRAARNLLARTFASLTEAVFVIDNPESRTIVQCNAAAERIFGYAEDELVGQTTRVLHVDDEAYLRFGELSGPVLHDREVFSCEFEMKRKDGTIIRTEHTVTLMRADADLSNRVVSVVRDVTDRRRVEADLRLQSAALRAAANAVVITDRHGRIEWVNEAFTHSSGYTAEEAIGRTPGDLHRSGVHDGAFYARLWETILAGGVWRGEMINRHKDGHLVPEELTITPVKDGEGEPAHFIAIKRDLTEVKRLQGQVLQAQKLETVGQLAGGIAHDFNNLLTVINATADLAAADPDANDRLRGELRQIREAGERAAGLTRQLLAFSRKQILQPRILHLGTLVGDMQAMLGRLIGEDVEIVVRPPTDAGHVRADPGQLEQVVLNLVVNARDAMPGGGRLTIETRDVTLDEADAASRGVDRGRYVMLAVSDTGIGMDEATRSRIFEPYFTTKEAAKGTGLGLSTVYGIVSQSGGDIAVFSQPGRGTTFEIFFPHLDAPPGGDVRTTTTTVPGRREIPTGTETVLIVEDEAAVRLLAQRILKAAGYTVLTAADAVAALTLLAGGGVVNLLVTDVVLPGMSGRDLADRVSRARPEVKILFTSGYTDDAILRHGVLDREVAFLGKPYTVDQLTRKVRDVLDG